MEQVCTEALGDGGVGVPGTAKRPMAPKRGREVCQELLREAGYVRPYWAL